MAVTFDAKNVKQSQKLEVVELVHLKKTFLDDTMATPRSKLPALVIKGSGVNESQPISQNNKLLA